MLAFFITSIQFAMYFTFKSVAKNKEVKPIPLIALSS